MDSGTVFITGATAGIGKAAAYKFAEHGWNLIINGRRTDRLRELETEIKNNFDVQVLSLPFDVRDKVTVTNSIRSIPHDWKKIDVLLNNAGLAQGLSVIQEGNIEDWETMIDTNIKGLLYVSREIMSMMIEQGSGHIINLGSIAGKEAYLKGNVYCSTKHFVDAITKSMRIDMLAHRIKVTAVHPGAVETEFSIVRFKGDAERAKGAYVGYTPLNANDIADVIYFAATRPSHVVINDIVITPSAQANTFYMVKDADVIKK
jgi:3-hydroxy acid dehydrogenase / malonic semialdehyde reductase